MTLTESHKTYRFGIISETALENNFNSNKPNFFRVSFADPYFRIYPGKFLESTPDESVL